MRAAAGATDAFNAFRIESYRVITDWRATPDSGYVADMGGSGDAGDATRLVHPWSTPGELTTEATVKVHVGDQRIVATAEGNGPVNALDAALRMAVEPQFEALRSVHLTDYRVRVLSTERATGAVTRVLLDTSDAEGTWSTIGVSENIIEASWQALVDSVVFALVRAAARAAAVESSGGHADDGELTPSSGDDEISTHPGDGDTATIAVAAVRAR
jgi:hypothetical protein